MNPTEQKEHTSRLLQLERSTEKALQALSYSVDEELKRSDRYYQSQLTNLLVMVKKSRQTCDEQWRELDDPQNDRTITRRIWIRHAELDNRVYAIEAMTLWQRLRWLVTGRLPSYVLPALPSLALDPVEPSTVSVAPDKDSSTSEDSGKASNLDGGTSTATRPPTGEP